MAPNHSSLSLISQSMCNQCSYYIWSKFSVLVGAPNMFKMNHIDLQLVSVTPCIQVEIGAITI